MTPPQAPVDAGRVQVHEMLPARVLIGPGAVRLVAG